ncbi:DNA polymerase III subunit gamma/tau [Thiomicrorhabdus sediminis]|uniref:DNA-directed DNA polymerase n=1 Tax=Thiomicrorhabdus sediminis TaxID=2580412 RepID=A0A4P9K6N1_9GAMM|nr:DNA polymerase III subunit gamma/tau [Thiomicrorhabdus sediminis]QCU90715.1 DNA polymerase III subunit gamma/tau [Thiomicrorhabdus sediminis]
MSYTVLARKWRPKNFAELVGQTHVMQALANALDQQRLHHAYLFTGTRGVGKTTIARIFAKALNCQHGISSNPCGQCETCRSIDEGRFIDLIEVDAASKTKVDDTREILDNVQFAPTQGRYKVYLIDEVHMLSKSSFNALLKTLEEPPEHVKFLLATTDPHKLPITVLSRCLQFNLMRLTQTQIQTHLANILQQENIVYEDAALALLAKSGDGSARDSLSLLDQAIAYGAGQVMFDAVQTMLGLVDQQFSVGILQALANDDNEAIKQLIQQLATMGVDYQALLSQLIESLHAITYCQVFAEAETTTVLPKDIIIGLAEQFSAEKVQILYQIALLAKQDMALAPDIRIGFEMSLMRMLAFQPVQASQAVGSTMQASGAQAANSGATSLSSGASGLSSATADDGEQMLGNMSAEEAMANLASARSLVGKSAQKKTLTDSQNTTLEAAIKPEAVQNSNLSQVAEQKVQSAEIVAMQDNALAPQQTFCQQQDAVTGAVESRQNHSTDNSGSFAEALEATAVEMSVEQNTAVQASAEQPVVEEQAAASMHSDHLSMIRQRLKQSSLSQQADSGIAAEVTASQPVNPAEQLNQAKAPFNDSPVVEEVYSEPMAVNQQLVAEQKSPYLQSNPQIDAQVDEYVDDHNSEPASFMDGYAQLPFSDNAAGPAQPNQTGQAESMSANPAADIPPWLESGHGVAEPIQESPVSPVTQSESISPNMVAEAAQNSQIKPIEESASKPAAPIMTGDKLQDWLQLIEHLQINGMAAEIARNSVLVAIDQQSMQISIDPQQQYAMADAPLQQIEQAAQQAFGKGFKLQLVDANEHFTPAKYAQQQAQNLQSQAEQSISSDPIVQQLKQALNLEVINGSIKPV